MKSPKKPADNRRNSKQAAIFFIVLAALVGILILAIWVADRYTHFLDR